MASTVTTNILWGSPPVHELADARVRRGAVRRPVVAVEPTCLCGQALDCCHSAHCPRCGVTLRAS